MHGERERERERQRERERDKLIDKGSAVNIQLLLSAANPSVPP